MASMGDFHKGRIFTRKKKSYFRVKPSIKYILECTNCNNRDSLTESELADILHCEISLISSGFIKNNLLKIKCSKCKESKVQLFNRSKPSNERNQSYFPTGDIEISNEPAKTSEVIRIAKKPTLYKPDLTGVPKNQIVKCTFDGTEYKKGSVCPNFKEHKNINKVRKNKRSSELWGRMKNGVYVNENPKQD